MLSNMHTSSSGAHNYSNQHPYSLNLSSGSTGPFMNQNSDQPPASNHPVASNTIGQSFNLLKSNNTSLQTNQALSLTPVQPMANVAPLIEQIAENLEKSQANGTADGGPSHATFAQTAFSLVSKDKGPVQKTTPPQAMELEPPVEVKVIEKSSLPVSSKADIESVATNPTPVVSNLKVQSVQEVSIPKEADSPKACSSIPAPPESEKPIVLPVTPCEANEDPLHIPEKEKSPEKVGKFELKAETTHEEKSTKVENDSATPKKVETSMVDAVKPPVSEETVKEKISVQKIPEVKAVKATPRKTKVTPSREPEPTPVGTSTPSTSSSIGSTKRQRIRTQHYQSPLPEVEFVSKISSTSMNQKNVDEKLIVFYKNEFLAVRNAEGGFYLCQAVQNIYKSSPKIKIRWLSQDKNDNDQGEVYTPDFYDLIDFDCILTNLSLNKADKGKFILPSSEKHRTESILNRSLAVEKGEEIESPSLTEEHPDGLDLSLYRDEDQLTKRKGRKRNRKTSPSSALKETPTKKSPTSPKARKVAPAKVPAKKAAPKKLAEPIKKSAPVKPVASTVKSSKPPGKVINKTSTKTSPVVDQKKAKVLARIGRKTAVPAATLKSAKNNSKNGKAENKAVASSNKTVQPKASSNGSVKTAARSVRKSTRK